MFNLLGNNSVIFLIKSLLIKISILFILAFLSSMSYAGHLFTQSSTNTPTWIQAGQGIAIKQYGTESSSSSGNINLYFSANSSAPTGADTSSTAWWQWSTGDVAKITLPLTSANYTYTIAYDTASGGCAYDMCSSGTVPAGSASALKSGVSLPTHSGKKSSYTSSDAYFTWSIESLAGNFSLAGYRIYTSGGTINGTGAGPLTQDSVVSSAEVQKQNAASSTPPIGSGSEFTVAQLAASAVSPKFSGGQLNIASGSASSLATDFTIDANGGSINTGIDTTISGVLSDDSASSGGTLTKTGSSALTLSGTNTFTGNFVVDAGSLVNNGSLAGTVVLNANGSMTNNGSLVSAKFSGGQFNVASGSTSSLATNFSIDASGGSINTGIDTTISGVLSDDSVSSGGTLTKTGSSALTLSGTNTFTGNLVVDAGSLVNNGSLAGAVVVNANGMLKGAGTIAGITSSGTVSPGNSPGTLTSTGNIVLNSGNTLTEEIDGTTYSSGGGAGSYDRIVVTGANSTVTVGGTLDIKLNGISGSANNTFKPDVGDTFRIVTTTKTTGVNGTFGTINQPSSGLSDNTRFDVVYGGNYIDLTLTPESYGLYTISNGKYNDQIAMTALAFLRPTSASWSSSNSGLIASTSSASGGTPSVNPFGGLVGLSGAALQTAISQISGEIHSQSANDTKDQIASLLNSTMNIHHTVDSDSDGSAWGSIYTNRIEYKACDTASGYKSTDESFIIGRDLEQSTDERFGVGVSYSRSSLASDVSSTAENKFASLFTYYDGITEFTEIGSVRTELNGGLGLSKRAINRTVNFNSSTNTHNSSTTEPALFGKARLSRPLIKSNTSMLTGYSSLSFQSLVNKSYQETGPSDTALYVKSGIQTSAEFEVGTVLDFNPKTNAGDMIWRVDFGLKTGLIESSRTLDRDVSLDQANWTIRGSNIGFLIARIAAQGKWEMSDNVSGFLSYSLNRSVGHNIYYSSQASLGFSGNF
jgi:autotransporter-associated beta strand protein